MSVSALAQKLKGSEIIKIAGEVNELKRKGQQVANLTIGDFDSAIYPIPDALTNEIKAAYDAHQTNYPPADGLLALRESVAGFMQQRHGLELDSNQILISSGSRPIIYATFLALVDPGDTVVFPAPSWNNNHYCDLTGANAVAVPTLPENNFMPTAAELKPHIKGATLLALCSPLNPTGTMFSKQALEEICDLVIEENRSRGEGEKPLYILYDQIYSMLTFGEHRHVDPVSLRSELKDYVVFIDGASKCFAATGVRVGWGFGPQNIINKMRSIVGHMGAWAPKAEQVAMAKFLMDKASVDGYLADLKRKIQESLNCLYTGFKKMKESGLDVDAIEPMGAIYLTIKINYTGKTTPDGTVLKDSTDINFYLIKNAKAAFVPFSAFGTGAEVNWFRASVGGCSLQEISEMLGRVEEALRELR
ncbi:MAG: aminotransferase class I/II-fold pyridoxal phosphate-dependent enzyme [Sphingobacteriaceae bacterium]|jgi:aspartate aminotransferase|nr:aminotransferase class I/II-fold pyridoxal phosphate-dependent enzyme [Sphingobacteriaceae bacterium]